VVYEMIDRILTDSDEYNGFYDDGQSDIEDLSSEEEIWTVMDDSLSVLLTGN
jgi:hypothetical protein